EKQIVGVLGVNVSNAPAVAKNFHGLDHARSLDLAFELCQDASGFDREAVRRLGGAGRNYMASQDGDGHRQEEPTCHSLPPENGRMISGENYSAGAFVARRKRSRCGMIMSRACCRCARFARPGVLLSGFAQEQKKRRL